VQDEVNQEESEQNEVDRTQKDLMFFSSDDLGNLVNGGRYCHHMILLQQPLSANYQPYVTYSLLVSSTLQHTVPVYISAY